MTGTFSFVHAADVHLDSPLAGLGTRNEAFAALVRGATRRAFANVADLAIDEGASFVVISGDLYDGTWKDHATGQYAVSQLARLARAGIRSFVIYGNHDAESRVTRHLALPEGVYAFGNRQCETVELADLRVAIHGRSYKEAATFENIASTYCLPVPGRFNLSLLHTALEGHAGHAPYAPCSVGELIASGHDYWALGHVHEASIRSESPHVVYPGNTQGRNFRETGAKGAMLVRVADGIVRNIEARACDEVRWARKADGHIGIDEVPLLMIPRSVGCWLARRSAALCARTGLAGGAHTQVCQQFPGPAWLSFGQPALLPGTRFCCGGGLQELVSRSRSSMRSVACLWLADKAAGRWPTGRVRQSHYETEGLTSYTVDPLADGISLLAKANDRSGDERPQARRHQRAPAWCFVGYRTSARTLFVPAATSRA